MQKYTLTEAQEMNQQAMHNFSKGNSTESLRILLSLTESFDHISTPTSLEVLTLNNLAYIYLKLSQPHFAIKFLSRAALLSPKTPEECLLSIGTHLNILVANSNLGFHSSSIQEGYKVLEMLETNKNPEILALTYYNMACEFAVMKKHEKALEFFHKAADATRFEFMGNEKLAEICVKAADFFFQKGSPGKILKILHKNVSLSKTKVIQGTVPKEKEHRNKSNRTVYFKDLSKSTLVQSEIVSRDLRSVSKFDTKVNCSPKVIRKKFLNRFISSRSTAASSIGSTSIFNNQIYVEGRVKNISQFISKLESDLHDFTCSSKAIMNKAELDSV